MNVATSFRGCQARLRWRRSRSPERVHDGQIELGCQVRRLIEPPGEPAPWMERDRHDAGRIGEQVAAGRAHPGAQPDGERSPAVVFERVNDVSKRPLVGARRSRIVDHGVAGEASVRRSHEIDADPARIADGASRRVFKGGGARHASRRERHPDERIDDERQCFSSVISCRSALPHRRSSP